MGQPKSKGFYAQLRLQIEDIAGESCHGWVDIGSAQSDTQSCLRVIRKFLADRRSPDGIVDEVAESDLRFRVVSVRKELQLGVKQVFSLFEDTQGDDSPDLGADEPEPEPEPEQEDQPEAKPRIDLPLDTDRDPFA
jgi:hypothetical protein